MHAPALHRWTVAQYLQAAHSGALGETRVELIDGEIVDMAPQGEPHALAVARTARSLMHLFNEPDFVVRIQSTLHLADASAPEPDVAVVKGPGDPAATGPHRPLLVVEISDTTLAYDQTTKASLYAANAVPDYWILNLVSGYLEVHRDPIPDPAARLGFRYASLTLLRPGQSVSPLALPGASIDVARLLP